MNACEGAPSNCPAAQSEGILTGYVQILLCETSKGWHRNECRLWSQTPRTGVRTQAGPGSEPAHDICIPALQDVVPALGTILQLSCMRFGGWGHHLGPFAGSLTVQHASCDKAEAPPGLQVLAVAPRELQQLSLGHHPRPEPRSHGGCSGGVLGILCAELRLGAPVAEGCAGTQAVVHPCAATHHHAALQVQTGRLERLLCREA